MALMDPQAEGIPQYKHIQRNDFFNRRHKKQKEEDIVVCDCRYNVSDPDSACGERCLNVLTSTECTPGYCPCGYYCKNQKFQRCEYAKSRLFKTGGRGWGVLADEDIKAGQFIIEYCGEVIPGTEARKRSHDYENQGLVDAYIISLNASESIDATKRGSLARFINHSCHPNCETRKWNVLGEIRVGIFAKQDIPAGTELAYDYNFEWYGGAKVRCLCGAPCCSGFLGAKSRGFQEATSYELQESECRFSVDNMPLYDSEEDEPTSPLIKVETSTSFEAISNAKDGFTLRTGDPLKPEQGPQFPDTVAVAVTSVPMEGVEVEEVKTEPREDKKLLQDENNPTSAQTNPITALFSNNNTSQNYQIQTVPSSNKKMQQYNKRSKKLSQKEVDAARVCQLLPSKEAQEEVHRTEERKKQANSELNSLFEEIRPAIEEHERDNQDSVPTTVGEKWVESHCANMKAQFEFSSSIIKNLLFASQRAQSEKNVAEATEKDVN